MNHRYRSAAALLALLASLLAAAPAAASTSQDRLVSATPVAWTPHVLDGAVKAFAQVGDMIVAGGSFSRVDTGSDSSLVRSHIFAFDAQTGSIDPDFAPTIDGEVRDIVPAPDGHSVFVSGTFQTVNGVAQPLLAELDLQTGALEPFDVAVSGREVDSLALAGGRLYIAGAFSQVDGAERSLLAAVDPQTGALDPDVKVRFGDARAGLLKIMKIAASPDGTRMLAAGTFLKADGLPRGQIAMLDLSSDPVSVSPWSTERFAAGCDRRNPSAIRGLDFSPDGSYFVVASVGGYMGGPSTGTLCDSVSRWETAASGPGQQPTWVDYSGGDSLTAVAATGTAVYVGGHQRWLNNPFTPNRAGPGAVARSGIAALDPQNGLPYSWNPGKTRGKGVYDLFATDQGLWVGSDTTVFAGRYRPRIAMVPLAGGHTVPAPPAASPSGELYLVGMDGRVTRRSFGGTSLGRAARLSRVGLSRGGWSAVQGAFLLAGRLYGGASDGRLYTAPFDGRRLGRVGRVSLRRLSASRFPVARISGMFYQDGRLYYTVRGKRRLYWRAFEPQSRIVGAQAFAVGGLDCRSIRGMTLAGSAIVYATAWGRLARVDFAAGRPVPGTGATIARAGGPHGLASRAIFLRAG